MVSSQFGRLSTFIRFEKARERFHKKSLHPKPSPTVCDQLSGSGIERRLFDIDVSDKRAVLSGESKKSSHINTNVIH